MKACNNLIIFVKLYYEETSWKMLTARNRKDGEEMVHIHFTEFAL